MYHHLVKVVNFALHVDTHTALKYRLTQLPYKPLMYVVLEIVIWHYALCNHTVSKEHSAFVSQ